MFWYWAQDQYRNIRSQDKDHDKTAILNIKTTDKSLMQSLKSSHNWALHFKNISVIIWHLCFVWPLDATLKENTLNWYRSGRYAPQLRQHGHMWCLGNMATVHWTVIVHMQVAVLNHLGQSPLDWSRPSTREWHGNCYCGKSMVIPR